MTDEAALLRAICAHPDEDTPRLAFADLLEEESDSLRAAFIRKQVELARAPEYDPLWVKCQQFDPATISGWAMAHTLPTVPPGYSWHQFEFRRGFPWKVGVRSLEAFVDGGSAIFDAAPIQALEISDRGRVDLAALAEWPHLARLRRLDFSVYRVGPTGAAHLCKSEFSGNLRELTFASNAITAEGLETLAGSRLFRQIEVFELRSSAIAPALLVDALAAAQGAAELRVVSLHGNRVTQYDAPHLFALPVMRDLEKLDLEDNRLDVAGVEALAQSGIVRGLRTLNLGRTRPGVPGLQALLSAGGMSGIRSLNLSNNRLGPVAAKALAESPAARGLRVLNLSNNPIGHAGVTALAKSKSLAGLIDLDVSDVGLGDAGAMELADSPHLDGLIRLNLRGHSAARPLGHAARTALEARFGGRVTI
ncbi:MAG TPA: TIGR02996 domain-containing protein [Gemmataceae bacterium]|nr:TIGR02996 domain-containing protein [Gemmataceae bacterium]